MATLKKSSPEIEDSVCWERHSSIFLDMANPFFWGMSQVRCESG